jgi:hypothetical protein
MVSVRFVQHYSPYNGGELASFPQEEAVRLVKMKVAEMAQPPAVAEVATPVIAHPDVVDSAPQMGRSRGSRR